MRAIGACCEGQDDHIPAEVCKLLIDALESHFVYADDVCFAEW